MIDINVVTSSRADFGILKNLCVKLQNNNFFNFSLIVTGSHLDKKLGYSIKEIKNSKLKINKKIKINSSSKNTLDILNYNSEVLKKFSKYFSKNRPDILLLLGDRFEIFAVAQTAYTLNIPIAHLHGGEVTHSVLDEAFRHSITKMSNLHFVSTKKYKERVIQLGEHPKNVINVGSLAVENIKKIEKLSKKQIETFLSLKFLSKNILVAYHIETNNYSNSIKDLTTLLQSLKLLKDTLIIFTYPNNDPGYKKIISLIEKFKINYKNSKIIKHLGHEMFINVLRNVDCIIGNSSSGIIEAPSVNIPTINLGYRQSGRMRSKSVISINSNKNEIIKSLNTVFNKKKRNTKKFKNPYQKNNSSDKIISNLLNFDFKAKKKFFDL